MISIDEMEVILEEIVHSIPKEVFKGLNGGVLLLPETKLNPMSLANDLYIMGEYHHGGVLGRYITLYYGSFKQVYGNLSKDQLSEKLMATVKHELVHHLETMAGERDLEYEDAAFMEDYFKKHGL